MVVGKKCHTLPMLLCEITLNYTYIRLQTFRSILRLSSSERLRFKSLLLALGWFSEPLMPPGKLVFFLNLENYSIFIPLPWRAIGANQLSHWTDVRTAKVIYRVASNQKKEKSVHWMSPFTWTSLTDTDAIHLESRYTVIPRGMISMPRLSWLLVIFWSFVSRPEMGVIDTSGRIDSSFKWNSWMNSSFKTVSHDWNHTKNDTYHEWILSPIDKFMNIVSLRLRELVAV